MEMFNDPIDSMQQAINQTIEDKYTLPSYELVDKNGNKVYFRPTRTDIFVHHFPQAWGSTAQGFDMPGLDKMTIAYTTAIANNKGEYAVFFSGLWAYSVEGTREFLDDLKKMQLKSQREAENYYKFLKLKDEEN